MNFQVPDYIHEAEPLNVSTVPITIPLITARSFHRIEYHQILRAEGERQKISLISWALSIYPGMENENLIQTAADIEEKVLYSEQKAVGIEEKALCIDQKGAKFDWKFPRDARYTWFDLI